MTMKLIKLQTKKTFSKYFTFFAFLALFSRFAFAVEALTFEELFGMVAGILSKVGIGIGLLFIIKAGYTYMTSQGAPEKVKAAQEDLTAAVTGIIFILLSMVVLGFIMSSLIAL